MVRRVRARISDDDRLSAVEAAAEEHGSQAEAIRHAIDVAYRASKDDTEVSAARDLPADLRDGYAALVDRYGTGSRIGLESAKSAIAQATKTPKEDTIRSVIEPLRQRGYIGIHTGRQHVGVVIPERAAADGGHVPADRDGDRDDDTDDVDVDEEFDRLESAEIDRGDGVETDGAGDRIAVSPLTGIIYAVSDYEEDADGRITAFDKRPLSRAEIGERREEVHGPVRRAYAEGLEVFADA